MQIQSEIYYSLIEKLNHKYFKFGICLLVIIIKILIAISVWNIPFSWDNWRYLATTHSILSLNFDHLVLSGYPYQSFYTFPPGLPFFTAITSFLTGSLYDAGKLTVLLFSIWFTFITYRLLLEESDSNPILGLVCFAAINLYPSVTWISHAIYPESILIPIVFYGLYRTIQFDVNTTNTSIIGFLTGVAFLIKPEGLLIATVYGALVLIYFIKGLIPLKFLFKLFFIGIIPFLIITTPYVLNTYIQKETLLPFITNYHLETYTSQAGNTIFKFSRNVLDNLVNLWKPQFSYIHIPLLLPIALAFFSELKKSDNNVNKGLIVSSLAVIIFFLVQSKAFGITYFEQLNPNDALRRYTILYAPLLFTLFYYATKALNSKIKIVSILYLGIVTILMLRHIIPIAYYYPKGWTNMIMAQEISTSKHYSSDKSMVSNPAILTYLEHENGYNVDMIDAKKIDSSVISYSILMHSLPDTLVIYDIMGRTFKVENEYPRTFKNKIIDDFVE